VEDFVKKNVVVTAAALLMIASAAAPALAQSPAPTPPPPAAALQKTPPFMTAGTRVDLSIEEAVARARDKNIDIAVARITPRLTDFSIAGLEANYRLNLTSSANNQRNTALPSQTTQGISTATTTTIQNWQAGFTQNLYRGGGNYSVGWTNSRTNSPSTTNLRNPQLRSNLTLQATQPLMRGFRIDATRAALRTNRISQQNDEIALQATTSTTAANTRNAYWDLVFAIQAVEAAQNSLDISGKLVQDNQARVEIGTLAPIDIKSAEAEQANRRLTLVQAQATVRTAELALKRLIVSGTDDPLWSSSINPVDRPAAAPESINVIVNSGYLDALRNVFGLDAPAFTVGVNFAYPIGKSAQEATVARSRLSLEQTQANLKSLQLQIATDVANAALTVQSSLESVQASAKARELAQERLNAMQSKFEVGMSTNFEVVQAQRDFLDSQNNELRALLNYRKALVNFEAVQTVGTRGVAAVGGGGGL
jgi:outer membrane protein